MNTKYQDTAKFLCLFNEFKKNMDKLYADSQTVISEKLHPRTIEWDNDWSIFNNKSKSTWIYQYHYLIDSKILGFSFVISVDEENFYTEDYKSIMKSIDVDPKVPLILLYGVFDPIDIKSYNAKAWWQLCLGYSNWSKSNIPEKYTLGTEINIQTGIQPESYHWFYSAKYKIVSMLEIDSQNKVEEYISDLLSMAGLI